MHAIQNTTINESALVPESNLISSANFDALTTSMTVAEAYRQQGINFDQIQGKFVTAAALKMPDPNRSSSTADITPTILEESAENNPTTAETIENATDVNIVRLTPSEERILEEVLAQTRAANIGDDSHGLPLSDSWVMPPTSQKKT